MVDDPQNRMTGESHRAWSAYLVYRDLGPRRSLSQAAAKYLGEQPSSSEGDRKGPGKPVPSRMRLWCEKWQWVRRAHLWDEHLEKENRIAQREAIIEMRKRQADEFMRLGMLATRRYALLVDESNTNPSAIKEMTLSEARQCKVEFAKMERMARGEATEIVQTQDDDEGPVGDDANLIQEATLEELRALRDNSRNNVEIFDRIRTRLQAKRQPPETEK